MQVKDLILEYLNQPYFKSAVAFFFLFFLHGFSIGNGQQGISYNVYRLNAVFKNFCEGKFVNLIIININLMVYRQPNKYYGNKWKTIKKR